MVGSSSQAVIAAGQPTHPLTVCKPVPLRALAATDALHAHAATDAATTAVAPAAAAFEEAVSRATLVTNAANARRQFGCEPSAIDPFIQSATADVHRAAAAFEAAVNRATAAVEARASSRRAACAAWDACMSAHAEAIAAQTCVHAYLRALVGTPSDMCERILEEWDVDPDCDEEPPPTICKLSNLTKCVICMC